MSSFATDGKDGHELKLEKVGPTFSSFSQICRQKSPKKKLWLVLPDEICLISSSSLFRSILCTVKLKGIT